MRLTEKDGLFSFKPSDREEMKVLRRFVEHMKDGCYELRLKSYSFDMDELNVTGIHLEWEKSPLNKIKSDIKECIEFGKPIPMEVQELYNRLVK